MGLHYNMEWCGQTKAKAPDPIRTLKFTSPLGWNSTGMSDFLGSLGAASILHGVEDIRL